MTEKSIGLVILSLVVVIALVGLILVYTQHTGAVSATQKAYPGGVIAPPETVKEYPSGYSLRYTDEPQGEPVVKQYQVPGVKYPTAYK